MVCKRHNLPRAHDGQCPLCAADEHEFSGRGEKIRARLWRLRKVAAQRGRYRQYGEHTVDTCQAMADTHAANCRTRSRWARDCRELAAIVRSEEAARSIAPELCGYAGPTEDDRVRMEDEAARVRGVR